MRISLLEKSRGSCNKFYLIFFINCPTIDPFHLTFYELVGFFLNISQYQRKAVLLLRNLLFEITLV